MKTINTIPDSFKGFSGLVINPEFRILRHIVFILVFLAYIIYSAVYYRHFIPNNHVFIVVWTCLLVINIAPAYLNIYIFIPKYLYPHRYMMYAACLLGIMALVAFLMAMVAYFLNKLYQSGQFLSAVQSMKAFIALALACPTAIILFRRWYIYEIRIGQLENATIQSELEQLKKQINPHFLLNMLNNANVLIKTNPKEASQVLVKLKDMLSYQLTDSGKNEVLLEDDIRFLTDFLNLEKLRRDNFEFTVTVKGNTEGIYVPPLLFIPFVENAVKHNKEKNLPYVHIVFTIEGRNLFFTCDNSKPEVSSNNNPGGLGLVNARRRLNLLFPGIFSLEIIDKVDIFKVVLQIVLTEKNELHYC